MFNLAHVLELVVNRFNERPFAEQNLVDELDQAVFPVFLRLGDELESPFVQLFKQGLRDITTVAEQFAQQVLGHVRHRLAVIGVRGRELKRQQLTLVVDNQVEFEAKVPAHRVFTPPRLPLKDFVRMGTAGVADVERGGVDERNASALALAGVQEAAQEHQAPGQQLDKATVADQVGKRASPVRQDAQGIKLLEGAKARTVKRHSVGEAAPLEPRHHFAQTQTGMAPTFTRHGGQLDLVLPTVLEVLIKIVQFTEDLGDVKARYDGVHS